MDQLDQLLRSAPGMFVLLPLLAFLLCLPWSNRSEKPIAYIAQGTKILYFAFALLVAAAWLWQGGEAVHETAFVLYRPDSFVFAIQFFYDTVTMVYSIVGSLLFFLVITFSRYYMHREAGFKRYFGSILLFFAGYNIVIFAGNFS